MILFRYLTKSLDLCVLASAAKLHLLPVFSKYQHIYDRSYGRYTLVPIALALMDRASILSDSVRVAAGVSLPKQESWLSRLRASARARVLVFDI